MSSAILTLFLALAPFSLQAGWPNVVFPSEPGITLVAGQTYTIEWTSVHLNPLPIHLIKWVNADSFAVVSVIAPAFPNPDASGTISWTVPSNIPSGSSYGIEVGVLGVAVAFSDNPFTIQGGGSPPPRKTAKITVEANPSYGGTASRSDAYEVGSQQQISASPLPCFIFTGWADGNTDNPRTVTVPSGGATYTANFLNILKDSVTTFDVNNVKMYAIFSPQGNLTLSEAAVICGVDHFNWVQHFTSVPTHWTLTKTFFFGNDGDVVTPPPPLLDPINTSNPLYWYMARSSLLPAGTLPLTFQTDVPLDNEDFYWNEPDERTSYETPRGLPFFDTPKFNEKYIRPSQDFVEFETELVGVYSDGSYKYWRNIGTNFRWKSNTRCDDQTRIVDGSASLIGYFKLIDPTNTPDVMSGGIFDMSVDSPSPLVGAKLQMLVNFVAGKIDQAVFTGSFEMQPGFALTNRHVAVTVGGVGVDFATDAKAKGASGLSRLKLRSKNGIGYLSATLKGDWNANWAAAGLINNSVKNKRVTMPVLLTFDNNPPTLFAADVPLRYTATTGKVGRARYKAN